MIKFIFKKYKGTRYYIVNSFYKKDLRFLCDEENKVSGNGKGSFNIWYISQELKNRNLIIEYNNITDDEEIMFREIMKGLI